MAQFRELNIAGVAGHSSNQAIINEASLKNVCFCCLSQNASVIRLSNCKHDGFIRERFNIDYSKLLVCSNCHNMLKKIEIFQRQVQESFMILKYQFSQKPTTKLINLQQSETTITTSVKLEENDLKEECDQCFDPIETTELTNESPPFEITTDVKIEHSDFENDLPLTQIRKDKKRKKVEKNFQIVKGKVKIVILSEEELMEERERESKKEIYLKLPFKCETCIKGFEYEANLKNHMEKQHGKKKNGITCHFCESVVGSEASYKEHVRRHVRRFECIVCGKRGKDVYTVSQHYNQQHGDASTAIYMKFNCNQCEFTTNSNRVYRYHREKHKQKPKCDVCGKTFSTNSSLKTHMYDIHKVSPREYKCSVCDKTYKCKSGFLRHMTYAHTNENGGFCAQCLTTYATRTGYLHHMRTHSAHVTDDRKKFVCDECGAKFLTKPALQTHIDWEHLKNKKYKCNKCDKVLKSAVTLKVHKQYVHEKKRPPRDKICDYCGKAFTTTPILISHIRTHTGERPLRCKHCAATFAHSGALHTHCRLLHSK